MLLNWRSPEPRKHKAKSYCQPKHLRCSPEGGQNNPTPGGNAESRRQESHENCSLEWHLLQRMANGQQLSMINFYSQWSIFIKKLSFNVTCTYSLTLVHLLKYHRLLDSEAGLLQAATVCHNSMHVSSHFCTFPFTHPNIFKQTPRSPFSTLS